MRSVICVPGGKFPTHKAWPDCLGLRGGPRSAEDVCREESELLRLMSVTSVSNCSHCESKAPYLRGSVQRVEAFGRSQLEVGELDKLHRSSPGMERHWHCHMESAVVQESLGSAVAATCLRCKKCVAECNEVHEMHEGRWHFPVYLYRTH